jgi:IS4 transposase
MKFLTNVLFLSAVEIADLYKSRWEIETFFKFIKQEMNFSHLLSRSENGIKVIMYLTMIAAILLTLYKKMNQIVGWTVAKLMFLNELDISVREDWKREIIMGFSGFSP